MKVKRYFLFKIFQFNFVLIKLNQIVYKYDKAEFAYLNTTTSLAIDWSFLLQVFTRSHCLNS